MGATGRVPYTIRQRLRYRLDNLFSRGATGMVAWLGAATLALILLTTTVATVAGIGPEGEGVGFIESLWLNMLRTLDPGTMGADVGWPFRVISLVTTLGGILIVSSLIGLLASAISAKVEELQRGKSLVLETGHTLVLGWSPKIFPILSELLLANANQRSASIVVLAPVDKSEMDEQIRSRVGEPANVRILCRTGVPFEHADLAIANPQYAKSVIALGPAEVDQDAQVIKTVLALVGNELVPRDVPVVAEIAHRRNADALRAATGNQVVVIQPAEVIAHVTAQISRQPGLSVVYQELLDFDGDEIYFHEETALVGAEFGDCLNAFESSAVMGVRFADGRVQVKPPMDTVLRPGDQVIAIAADDDKITFTGFSVVEPAAPAHVAARAESEPERILVLGWNELGPLIIRELDRYVSPGSKVKVALDPNLVGDGTIGIHQDLTNLSAHFEDAGKDHDDVDRLLREDDYGNVMILCYRHGVTEAQADARALMTLLQTLQTASTLDRPVHVITELLDVRDVRLAPQTTADHFVVSERLSSLLLVQLSENVGLLGLFADLFDAEGAEIYLRPANTYLEKGETVRFSSLVESGRRREEIVLGYRIASLAHAEEEAFGVFLNPPKSRSVTLSPDDSLIVLAEDA
ncbi:MAG: potassium transporter TrkA [Actinomycetota bacterium]|nr:potassium transporter TrkA [Actinomycetota bacterium]